MRKHFIRQTHIHGISEMMFCTKAFVGEMPFVVLLGDDLMWISQKKRLFHLPNNSWMTTSVPASTIAVICQPHDEESAYGVIAPHSEKENGLYSVETPLLKNQLQRTLLALAQFGRYLPSRLKFSKSSKTKLQVQEMNQHSDALDTLNKTQRVFMLVFNGARVTMSETSLAS